MFPERANSIKPFFVMDILQRAKEIEKKGIEVIHLEVGEPDFKTPSIITKKTKELLESKKIGYTHSLGIFELREAIADYYNKKYNLTIDPSQVIVTNGSSPAFLIGLGSIVEKEKEVIISDPHYPCYPNFIKFIGAIPKYIPTPESSNFQFDLKEIKKIISSKTVGIFINSPSNPTGTIIPKEKLKEIADLNLWIFSDEIYHGLNYSEEVHSVLEFTDKCLVFNGFSKLFAMTGWRLGYMIVPKFLIKKVEALVQNFFISANTISQWAGYFALTEESVQKEIKKMISIYNKRRKFILNKLKETGFEVKVEPKGAFYVFANAHKFIKNKTSYEFSIELLEKTHVAVTPGTDFGTQGEHYLRFSYANSIKNISKAFDRLKKFLK